MREDETSCYWKGMRRIRKSGENWVEKDADEDNSGRDGIIYLKLKWLWMFELLNASLNVQNVVRQGN